MPSDDNYHCAWTVEASVVRTKSPPVEKLPKHRTIVEAINVKTEIFVTFRSEDFGEQSRNIVNTKRAVGKINSIEQAEVQTLTISG